MKNATAKAKNSKTETAAQTAPKSKGAKAQELKELNQASAASKANAGTQEPAQERETKYIYPEACKSKEEKKTFRRKARQQRSSFDKQLDKLKASNAKGDKEQLKTLQAQVKEWESLTYSPDTAAGKN